jgi:hypothetical protein
MIMDDP